MSRDRAIDLTLVLPGIKRPVGRPRTGKALSDAERMKRYRERQKEKKSLDQLAYEAAGEFPSLVTEIIEFKPSPVRPRQGATRARSEARTNGAPGAARTSPKTSFFSVSSHGEKNDQRRSSTADQSGIPDSDGF